MKRAPRYRLSLVREGSAAYDAAEQLSQPGAVARFLWQHVYHDAATESMAALYLDARLRLVGFSVPYVGTLGRAAVEPRGVLVPALLCNAASFVVAHNHPSGDPTPSSEDYAFTRRLADAGEMVGVRLADHVIIGDGPDRWASLQRLGGWGQ